MIDTVFLAAWVVVNWSVDRYVVEPMRLAGSDATLLNVFRGVFGGSTLVAVVAFVAEDLVGIWIGVVRRIRSTLAGKA